MPSTHTQVMAYSLGVHATLAFVTARGSTPPGAQRLLQIVEALLLLVATALVGHARIYLGYHTVAQVFAGAAVGAGCASLWTCASVAALRKRGDRLLRLPFARDLGLTNRYSCGLPFNNAVPSKGE